MGTRRAYPTDLTESQWDRASRYIPPPKRGGRPAKYERREIVNALLYVECTGCQWREIPAALPPWRVVYWYFMQWNKDGTLLRLLDELEVVPRYRRGVPGRP